MTTWYEVTKTIQSFGYTTLSTTKKSITFRPFDHTKIDHEVLTLAVPVEQVELWKILKHILLEREYKKWDSDRYNALPKCQFLVIKTENQGLAEWKECSKGIDLAGFNACDRCNQYSPVTARTDGETNLPLNNVMSVKK
jgi:hypothetical protein